MMRMGRRCLRGGSTGALLLSLLGGLNYTCAVELKGGMRGRFAAKEPQPEIHANKCYESGVAPSITRDTFPMCTVLSPGAAVLYWQHNGTAKTLPKNISIALVVKGDAMGRANTWTAVGMSQANTGMIQMDVAMLRLDGPHPTSLLQRPLLAAAASSIPTGFRLEDRYANGPAMPELDDGERKPDKTLLFAEARPAEKAAFFAYSAEVSYCDGCSMEARWVGEDSRIDPKQLIYVNWAFGASAGGDPSYHGPNRGILDVDLLSPPTSH